MKTATALLGSLAAVLLTRDAAAYSPGFDLFDHTSQLNFYHPANPFYPLEQTKLPDACKVDQVHIVSRHTTRYPSKGSYNGVARIATKIKDALAGNATTLSPEFEFLRTWDLSKMITNPTAQVENITALGLTEAFEHGAQVRSKYAHLYHKDMTVWSGSVERVQLTAKSFMNGLFGQAAADNHYVHLVTSNSSDKSIAGNTLTPIDTCTKFPKGIADPYQAKFVATWVPQVIARLEARWPGFGFIQDDVLGMMDLCMYEMNLSGKDQRHFCMLFTDDEWVNYGYNKDLGYFHDSSWGNPLARTTGLPYVKAVGKLLAQPKTASCQNIYVAFSHDTQLMAFMTAYGLNKDAAMAGEAVDRDRRLRSSRMVPMGARLVTERLNCGTQGSFVRALVNDAVVPFEDCKDGPGLSCSIEKHLVRLKNIEAEAGDFMTKCGVVAADGLSSELKLFDNPQRNLCTNLC
ncbi:hypothetical protein PybrP1_009803 [[Pythium] brassicae (nom. inval.)]|nr:hypothetical protein PybrP1_009803 [[Pythium] brassicae (nom. inval.)]